MKLKTDYNYNRGLAVLKEASKSFPNGSGVYKFIDSSESIIYIGKAKNLRKRISSYSINNNQTRRIKTLISLTNKLEFIKTPTEIDSLILENNLIKKIKPPFNIRLMDDKSFPYIMISKSQEWPRIKKYRGKQTAENIFFGPFANVSVVDEVLKQLEKAFLIRSCSDNIFNSRKRPCILHQIKRCSAPCVGLITSQEYSHLVNEAILFLKGKNPKLKSTLVKLMEDKSKQEDYEQAAIIRDRIKAISRINFEQYSDLNKSENFDIVFLYQKFDQVHVQLFFFRSGKNLGNKDFFLSEKLFEESETILRQFLIFFYKRNTPPDEILINFDLKNTELIKEVISPNKSLEIKKPKKGKKLELMKLVKDNIQASSKGKQNIKNNEPEVLKSIYEKFKLKNFPFRIEVYDNSHLSGTDAIGAMIVYQNFEFSKNHYKKFNTKTKSDRIFDDYEMMAQMIERRFNFSEEWKNELPNLIIIDGGKGQLNTVQRILKKKKISNIDLLSISKGTNRRSSEDKVHSITQNINLNNNEKEFYFIQKLRDEAHRFAISSHKAKRSKKMKGSIFDQISGIGKKTKYNLLNYFGTIENIQSASLTDLKKVEGIGSETAKKIYKEFNKIV
ncbi:MAG: excinuclease ABC subunit C [Rickettsiales bacterium]|nr:excinuclease ABC subunit C [Rickettsiales bacterium]RPG15774.1 MAG: excinuclease ABC subunit UvrC [Pelagibacteraceae bacterium TMED195]|tara:strand:- start:742 stop:2586 length:1845 start_codon:yes stop_codon:yes gene_type:complete